VNSSNTWKLGEWTLSVRAIRRDDEALWLELMKDMSWATRYKRGARRLEDLNQEDVRRAVAPDPAKEIALVALAARGGKETMAGVARGVELRAGTWEFALVVLDAWQRRGVGRRLMIALMDTLQERQGKVIEGDVLATNRNMLDFVARLGFEIHSHPEQPHVKRVRRKLRQREAPLKDERGRPE
jgi:acetyltransferase